MNALLANVTLPSAGDLAAFSPELVVIATAVAALLLPFFVGKSGRTTAILTAIGGGIAAILAGTHFAGQAGREAFSGLLVTDGASAFLRLLIYGFLALVAVMWLITAARRSDDATVHDGPEFFLLMLAAAVGMGLMVSTRHLLMVIIAVEMASLPSYAMSGFQKRRRLGAEAALKYVVFGASTAAIMIYGVSLLYGQHGTLDVHELAAAVGQGGWSITTIIGLVGLLVGVGFKVSAVPFHFWCPDVFEGASVEVATFLSVASKAAGLTLLLRLVYEFGHFAGASAPGYEFAAVLALVIGLLATVTATLGNLAALAQDNLKRLLAYSSIAHAGYVLMALAVIPFGGDDSLGTAGSEALMLYLLVYLFMNLGAFSVVALVYNRTGSEDIRTFAGLGKRAPLLAVPMVLFMLSLVGLPPLTGFFAKFQLFWALFYYEPMDLRWLVAVGLVNTVVSLFYYMRVVKTMWLDKPDDDAPLAVSRVGAGWVIGIAVPVTLLWLAWGPLKEMAEYFNLLLAG